MGRRGILKIISGNKDELASPWLLAYVPIRSCHRVLKDKYGEFSPPAFHADFPVSFWCNWTIWAGSRKHIIIYIQRFISKDACNKNEDKILFEGVSSLVENSVVYACWKKEMHVFATFAQAVHVVLLKRYLPNQRDGGFKGKYYIFQDQQGASSSKDGAISGTSAPKLQKKDVSELGPPWVTEYFPIRSCHRVLRDGSGLFHLPLHVDIKANIWCNWTIWAGPQKHIVIYVQGFQGSDGCGNNQDRIIFQGVSSSVETKVVFACHNRGTLVFAAQATEVQVLLLSGSGSRSHEYRYFRGQYYVFRDSETVGSSSDTIAAHQEPVQETSKNESWRTVETKGLLSMLTAPPGPPAAPAGGRIQPGVVSPEEVGQHSPDLMEDGQSAVNQSECGQDETRLEKNLKDRGSKGREAEGDMLMEPAPAGQDTGGKAEPPALELPPGTALVTVVPCHLADSPCSEMPSSSVGVSASGSPSEVPAAAHHTQTPELAEPPLSTSTKPPLYPSPGVTAADVVSQGGRTEEILDLISSVGNDTGLQSQHHPGDVLFEVTAEIKPKDWIPHGGSEVQKGLLESLKDHIQKNLKLSANRVSEIKLKDVKRTSDANLLLTFWLHLEPEDRNVSLLLRSHLEELLGTSVGVEKLQLVSLFVEDVNECQAGLGLCGEEAECFNGVGTYLCRCKQGYEDHSPTKSGTLCIRAPRAGRGWDCGSAPSPGCCCPALSGESRWRE
ncbi:hypothetical protein EK904_006933 [Melospiza melodia maxima]|nr:hypothetical protein EK904_006933 [Melospiza melodia maxima]